MGTSPRIETPNIENQADRPSPGPYLTARITFNIAFMGFVFFLTTYHAPYLYAEEKSNSDIIGGKRKTKDRDKKTPKEEISQTRHRITIDGNVIEYTATAGTLLLKEEGGAPRASVFFTAYTAKDRKDISERPVTFSFNGGPGSSSVWLHLGLLGPRRISMDGIENNLPPPYRLIDNEHSILDVTDLVFIDPVSTGFSRAVAGQSPKKFHGVQKDLESVGEFIRLYTTRYKRWSSPKFLIGESYGTTRAAGLTGHLQDRFGMYLNGIMLISSILDFQTIRFDIGNDLPYILFLPAYTATAWYHKKLPGELQGDLRTTLKEVEEFALGKYTLALMKGTALSEEEHRDIVGLLSRYTGLTEEYVEQTNLRINIFRFAKELLRDRRRTVGRFDSRILGIDQDAAGETYDYDPSYTMVHGPASTTLNDYVRTELQFESDLPYEILTSQVHPWDYGKFKNRYLTFAEPLRQAMTKNPYLEVFVASGYYDLATPYFATEYTFNHLGLDSSLQDNISLHYYEAGHMMYFHEPSLAKLKVDIKNFMESAVKTASPGSNSSH